MMSPSQLRGFAVFGLMLVLALPSFAGDPPVRFFIESISVEGIRLTSSVILISESRLRTGQEYTHDDLREAVYRINRLPFVVNVRFSLRKGSQRDRYELVIEVVETERLYFGLDAFSHLAYLKDIYLYTRATAGVRQFIGAGGTLYGSVSGTASDLDFYGDSVGYNIGYTQYNLFGRPISATADLRYAPSSRTSAYSLGLGFQLPHNQSLLLTWSGSSSDPKDCMALLSPDDAVDCERSSSSRRPTAEWRFDTTNDILFPTSGTLLITALTYSSLGSTTRDPSGQVIQESESEDWGLAFSAKKHSPVTRRQSVAFGGSLGYSRTSGSGSLIWNGAVREQSFDQTFFHGTVNGEYALDLLQPRSQTDSRNLRWESSVLLGFGGSDFESTEFDAALTSSLVFRNRWGVIRLFLLWGF